MHCCTIIGWLSEWSFCSSKSSEGVKRLANAQVYSLCFCYWRVFFSVESTNKSCPPSSCSDHPKMLLSHKCWYEAVLGGNLLCCWIWRIPYKATYHTCSRVNLLFLFQNQRLEVGFQPIRESGQVMRDTSSHEGRMQRMQIQRNGRNTLVWNSGGALLFLWRSAPPESRAFYRSHAKRTARFGNNVCYSGKLDSLPLMGPPTVHDKDSKRKIFVVLALLWRTGVEYVALSGWFGVETNALLEISPLAHCMASPVLPSITQCWSSHMNAQHGNEANLY